MMRQLGGLKVARVRRLGGRALLCLALTLLYCEFIVYYLVLGRCSLPAGQLSAMVLADTHLLGARNGHWFDKLRREWQMHRTFQTAQTYFRPEHVFFLGDLFDEGQWCPPAEFDYYVKRFHSLFAVDETVTKVHVLPGNHDMGFHYVVSPFLNKRFKAAFKTKSVQLKVIQGLPFVSINSMAFEGDGCFLCRPAELAIHKLQEKLAGLPPPVLLSHFPLYRPSDSACREPDGAPPGDRGQAFRERRDCIGRDSSRLLLTLVKPRLVLSGHTHHGCNTSHGPGVTELTVSSFSWRNKRNPAFLLASFSKDDYHVTKCYMPDEDHVINVYIGSLVLFCVSLIIF